MSFVPLQVNARTLMQRYAEGHSDESFAEDAIFTLVPAPEPRFVGREAISGMLRLFYQDAFADARAEIRHVAVDAEQDLGFLEFTFRGVHTGELLGVAATHRQVEIPMFAVYELGGRQIQEGRLYFDIATLFRQLGVA